jgi:hypothetical protein
MPVALDFAEAEPPVDREVAPELTRMLSVALALESAPAAPPFTEVAIAPEIAAKEFMAFA